MKASAGRGKLRKTALWLLAVLVVLWHFPLHHYLGILGMEDFHTGKELLLLVTRGPVWDLLPAQEVMLQAEEAFSDMSSDREEAERKYGKLALYCQGDRGHASESHTLRLLTAHVFGDKGYLWVYYSQETHKANGDLGSGSWRIYSLWQIEKNESGAWEVVRIREHP